MSNNEQILNPNSALYWLGAVNKGITPSPIRTPETEIVKFDFIDSFSIIEGDTDPDGISWDKLEGAAESVGWPVFVRTDLTSAKHSGINAVKASNMDELQTAVAQLVQESVMKNMHPEAILLREWVDIDHQFTAFDGLPIGTEFRLFAHSNDVVCSHYYWPEDSIRDPSSDTWKAEREEAASTPLPTTVRDVAVYVAHHANRHEKLDTGVEWSIDFARDVDGRWWLIDMALGEQSWHPDHE